MFSAPFGV